MRKKPERIRFTTKLAMSRAFGVNRNSVSAWCGRPGFPGAGAGPWLLDEVIPWLIARQQRGVSTADPLMDGPASPGLERYRTARAQREEIELAKLRGKLVDRTETRRIMSLMAHHVRRTGDRLLKRFGKEAVEILNSGLDEYDRVMETQIPAIDETGATERSSDG
jgi:hypothetical protein